jgi:ectoine hydroxylase-related dioxygenase (phytanoyl-CoA dioxygenase family)
MGENLPTRSDALTDFKEAAGGEPRAPLLAIDPIGCLVRAGVTGGALTHCANIINNGFTVIPAAFDEATCDGVVKAFHEFESRNIEIFREHRDENGRYPRIVNLHLVLSTLQDLFAKNTTLLRVQDALFGRPATLFSSLFYNIGSEQPLHRDTPVFSTRPEYLYFGNTVYLEDADEENGCLEVLKGGNLIPELDRIGLAKEIYGNDTMIPNHDVRIWVEYQKRVVETGERLGLSRRKVSVKKGDALIWHPGLPHGGSRILNRSRTRYSFVFHTAPERVPVYHQNVFFAPQTPFSTVAGWGYVERNGRKVANHKSGVSFANRNSYDLSEFKN